MSPSTWPWPRSGWRPPARRSRRSPSVTSGNPARPPCRLRAPPLTTGGVDAEEADVLRRYVTDLDGPVFALVNLLSVVKGRAVRLLQVAPQESSAGCSSTSSWRPRRRRRRGRDRRHRRPRPGRAALRPVLRVRRRLGRPAGRCISACEQAFHNLLTKVLEWGRPAAYLGESTRYIAYDVRLGGRYRYYWAPEVLSSSSGTRYVGDLDRLDTKAELAHGAGAPGLPEGTGRLDFVHRQSVREGAAGRHPWVLPAALPERRVYGTGQGHEALLLRMRSSPLPEARAYADLMLTELRKVIPSFLKRVDLPDRGGRGRPTYADESGHRRRRRPASPTTASKPVPEVTLVDWDPTGRTRSSPPCSIRTSTFPSTRSSSGCGARSADERLQLVAAYTGDRTNRRHKPGRALERVAYRFDVCSDYGAPATSSATACSRSSGRPSGPGHGYEVPDAVQAAGAAPASRRRWPARPSCTTPSSTGSRPRRLRGELRLPRYSMQFNAWEAMHSPR